MGSTRLIIAAALAGAACGSAPVRQLAAPVARLHCDTVAAGGTIRGRVLFEPNGRPIRSRGVTVMKLEGNGDTARTRDHLHSSVCMAVTDSTGRFRIARVPPGRWEVRVANGGYHPTPALPVQVRAGSVAQVEFRLRPENMVADCLERPSCQSLLVPPPRLPNADDSTQLQLAGYSLAIAFAGGGRDPNPIACIAAASPAVFTALRDRYPFVLPDSACDRPQPGSAFNGLPRSRQRMVGRRSGRNAFRVGSSRIELRGDTAVVRSSYYVAPLWALGWRCRFVRAEGEWQPLWCGVEWVS